MISRSLSLGRTCSKLPLFQLKYGLAQHRKHYDALNVSPNATDQQIKKSYFKAAKLHHPDRGGNADKFKQIQQAYSILSDPQKRKMYDQFGEAGAQGGFGGFGQGFNPNDIFSSIFGGGFRGGQQNPRNTKSRPTATQIKVTLKDLYQGKKMAVKFNIERVCKVCNGDGSKSTKQCPDCKGQGVVQKTVQIAPGMFTRTQARCQRCRTTGKIYDPKDVCPQCKGNCVCKTQVTKNITIERGMPLEPIIIEGEGSTYPNSRVPGDLAVVLKLEPHPSLRRQGADLYLKKRISLYQALVGSSTEYEHLDGKKYVIKTKDGKPVGLGGKRKVGKLGMPFYRNPSKYGNLIIQFQVEFPQDLKINAENAQKLAQMLNHKGGSTTQPTGTPLTLQQVSQSDFNTNESGGRQQRSGSGQKQEGGVKCQAQ